MPEKCICVVYVDNTLLFAPKKECIDEAILKLKELGMELEEEDSVAGFLGIHIKLDKPNNSAKLTQKGLIKFIIEATQVNIPKITPALPEPLVLDREGEPPESTFSNANVVGMLLYLNHSRQDIYFATSQVARFIHKYKRSYELAVERISQYLLETKDQSLVIQSNRRFKFDCYVDADFAGS